MEYKLCAGRVGCGQLKPLGEFGRDAQRRDGLRPYCRPCDAARSRRYYREHTETVRQYCERNRERTRQYQRQYYQANKEKVLARGRQRTADAAARVFAHYGEACACCGRRDRLTIDHVHGDGKEHRKALRGAKRARGGTWFYCWLIQSGFPEGYQTLCSPCNSSKRTSTSCRLRHSGLQ
jgi:hypothetical protein